MKRLALVIATAGGAGLSPFAPGTAGSAVGVGIYLLTRHWPATWQLGLLAAVAGVGIWAGSVAARHYQREDPGQVVVDEVAGQLLALALTGAGVGGAVTGFFLFRAFDIVKPWPAGRLERVPGGAGIMLDDLVAGIYANLLLQILWRVGPWA